jgi:hypothetical protein
LAIISVTVKIPINSACFGIKIIPPNPAKKARNRLCSKIEFISLISSRRVSDCKSSVPIRTISLKMVTLYCPLKWVNIFLAADFDTTFSNSSHDITLMRSTLANSLSNCFDVFSPIPSICSNSL